jgi:hypothetical protein
MRILLTCLAFVLGLVFAAPASAQGFPPGPWRGIWTAGEYEYQAELNFTMELSGRVNGQFAWMLVRSPQHEEQSKIGMRAIEYVEGAFDASTGSLLLRGTRKDDPNGIIGVDVYRLVVSPNGQYIVGLTENNGSWQGRIELTRFGPS